MLIWKNRVSAVTTKICFYTLMLLVFSKILTASANESSQSIATTEKSLINRVNQLKKCNTDQDCIIAGQNPFGCLGCAGEKCPPVCKYCSPVFIINKKHKKIFETLISSINSDPKMKKPMCPEFKCAYSSSVCKPICEKRLCQGVIKEINTKNYKR